MPASDAAPARFVDGLLAAASLSLNGFYILRAVLPFLPVPEIAIGLIVRLKSAATLAIRFKPASPAALLVARLKGSAAIRIFVRSAVVDA